MRVARGKKQCIGGEADGRVQHGSTRRRRSLQTKQGYKRKRDEPISKAERNLAAHTEEKAADGTERAERGGEGGASGLSRAWHSLGIAASACTTSDMARHQLLRTVRSKERNSSACARGRETEVRGLNAARLRGGKEGNQSEWEGGTRYQREKGII
eukprot:2931199-Pleurochrysis_carterae.AAC.4